MPATGPPEGSSSWAPMRFNVSLPVGQRRYQFQANHFEEFLASHIYGPVESEARAVWTSGGYIHFTDAVFHNCHIVAASMPELTTACFKVTEASPPGFTLVFEGSLFVSGSFSNTFFQLYDAGIHVKNSRWLVTATSRDSFHVAKPKCAFGGNGNPLYVEGSRSVLQSDADGDLAWAVRALGTGSSDARRLASFECLAWDSPYIEGSYVFSPDSFGLTTPAAPMILAPDRHGQQLRRVVGASECQAYLRGTKPRFFCGESFGTYGLWCGSGMPLHQCPGVTADPASWYRSMLPWSSGGASGGAGSPDVGGQVVPPAAPAPSQPPDQLPVGDCAFPSKPPDSTPFVWDPSCEGGGLGCQADGSHMECRWCGFGPYLPCPVAEANLQNVGDTDSDPLHGVVALLISALVLGLILALCWYCSSRRKARPTCISQHPEAEAPSLLGRTALPMEKPSPPPPQTSGVGSVSGFLR